MKNKKNGIILLILLFLLILLICIYFLTITLKEEYIIEEPEIQVSAPVAEKTIRGIIEKNGSIYVKEERIKIYVDFQKDLYDEKGNSNKVYFENLIQELCDLEELSKSTFYLIDEEKSIEIRIYYDSQLNKHTITYNNTKDFFENTNGENYSKVDNVEIIEKIGITPSANELHNLVSGRMFFKAIRGSIGEGIDLGNGFESYKDGSILIKKADGRVRTIIFTDKYEEDIFHGIKVGTDLANIEKRYEGKTGGSLQEGYIMFRTEDVYVFFYEDEIVIYGYSYFYNDLFEEYLANYISNKDLQSFVDNMLKTWKNHEICEYDIESGYAHISYPSRGVEIKIENNDSLGITLYKNYYFTDQTKGFVKNGKISINDTEDYIEKFEKERKENQERITNE